MLNLAAHMHASRAGHEAVLTIDARSTYSTVGHSSASELLMSNCAAACSLEARKVARIGRRAFPYLLERTPGSWRCLQHG